MANNDNLLHNVIPGAPTKTSYLLFMCRHLLHAGWVNYLIVVDGRSLHSVEQKDGFKNGKKDNYLKQTHEILQSTSIYMYKEIYSGQRM